jgi:hypothetical protein
VFRHAVSLLLFAILPFFPLPAQQWPSYTALYKITYPTGAPNPLSNLDTSKEIIRAADGSKLSLKRDSSGQPIAGILWKGGNEYNLDYIHRRAMAFKGANLPHWELPQGAPIGTAKVAGLDCVIYPLHVTDGQGTMCVDIVHKVTARTEVHVHNGNGTQLYIEELTSIKFEIPPLPTIEIPRDFRVIHPLMAGEDPPQTPAPVNLRPFEVKIPCPPTGKAVDEFDLISDPDTLDQLILGSQLIVQGTITKVLPSFNRDPNIAAAIETDSIVSVSQTLLGILVGTADIALGQIGGKTEACEEIIPEDPPVKAGEQYILFLRKETRTSVPNPSSLQRYFAFGLWHGMAKIENGTIHFRSPDSKRLHEYDNSSASDFVSRIQQRIGPLGLTVTGKPKR